MQNKTLAALSYVTLIGWIIAFVKYNNLPMKSALVRYHLGQALGLYICSFILGLIVVVIGGIIPAIGGILVVIDLLPLVFMVLGIITALNETCKPLPLIGNFFIGKFVFLNK